MGGWGNGINHEEHEVHEEGSGGVRARAKARGEEFRHGDTGEEWGRDSSTKSMKRLRGEGRAEAGEEERVRRGRGG